MNRDNLNLGACLALAHSAHLLDDAALLYERNRVSSSFHMAVMAREEHGRFHLLLEMAEEIADSKTIDAEAVRKRLNPSKRPHQVKLQAGQFTFRTSSPLPKRYVDRLEKYKEMRRNDSNNLHNRRLAAQYVDLWGDGTWSRPSDTKPEDAESLIYEVAGELSDSLTWVEEKDEFKIVLSTAALVLPRSVAIQSRILSGIRRDGA